jgi:hypothetical protein
MAGKKKGGSRPGSGRKSKAQELGLYKLLDECWPLSDRKIALKKLAENAKMGDIASNKLLLEYTYGKPTERHEISGPQGSPLSVIVDSAIEKIYGDSDS